MQHSSKVPLQVSLWLLVVMIFIMVVLGGVTRLTGSGLSIVEWKPLVGILPPWGEMQWMQEFQKYQTSPEFMQINFDMTLGEFKSIFWLEYIHRLWGRLLAFVLLIPTYIALRRPEARYLLPKVVLLWLLGLAQGLVGWYMVKSGLVQDPHVSPYRLAAHLFLGFSTFAVALLAALSTRERGSLTGFSHRDLSRVHGASAFLLTCVGFTVLIGAMVAGLKAGLIYNTFPMMEDRWLPQEFLFYHPYWKNLTENGATLQFVHRVLATLTFIFSLVFLVTTLKKRVPETVLWAAIVLGVALCLQYALGVMTLLYHVPVSLGAAHQGVALLVFGILIYVMTQTRHRHFA